MMKSLTGVPIYNASTIKNWDKFTVDQQQITFTELMERAGNALYKAICKDFPSIKRPLIICGNGNNGGDGLVIARLFSKDNINPVVHCVEYATTSSPDYLTMLKLLPNGVLVEKIKVLSSYDLIIDCIFGIGFKGAINSELALLISTVNNSSVKIVSIDLPSGMVCDQWYQENYIGIKAYKTYTIGCLKPCLLGPSNKVISNKLEVIDIELDSGFMEENNSLGKLLIKESEQVKLKKRSIDAEKRQYGHGLIIGGAEGMAGAICLSALGALRSGIGLLTISSVAENRTIVQTKVPEATYISWDNLLKENLDKYSFIAIGPGLGRSNQAMALLKYVLNSNLPAIFDADALNLITQLSLQDQIAKGSVITPHFREACRFFGKENWNQIITDAKEFSAKSGIYCVLKADTSLIIAPNRQISVSTTGNPCLAKGGSGDLLVGILLGRINRMRNEHDICKIIEFAIWLHGYNADQLINTMHEDAVLTSDLIKHIDPCLKSLQA